MILGEVLTFLYYFQYKEQEEKEEDRSIVKYPVIYIICIKQWLKVNYLDIQIKSDSLY